MYNFDSPVRLSTATIDYTIKFINDLGPSVGCIRCLEAAEATIDKHVKYGFKYRLSAPRQKGLTSYRFK